MVVLAGIVGRCLIGVMVDCSSGDLLALWLIVQCNGSWVSILALH